MYGNGLRIAGIRTTMVRRRTAVRGKMEIAPEEFCEVGVITLILSLHALLTASETPRLPESVGTVYVLQ